MARYIGGIIVAPVRANMARDVFICTRTKKTPGKTGRFLLFGFGYGFKYLVTLTSATIANSVNPFINSRIY